MKYPLLTLLFLASFLCTAQSITEFARSLERRGPVNDFAELLSSEEEKFLTSKIEMISEEVGQAYSICVIEDLNGFLIRDLATEIGKNWQSGAASDNYAILFLFAQNDKEVFIATSRKVRRDLLDSTVQVIVDNYLIPNLRNNDYFTGISTGISRLQYEMEKALYSSKENKTSVSQTSLITTVFILALILLFIYDQHKLGRFDPDMRRYRASRRRSGLLGGHSSSYSDMWRLVWRRFCGGGAGGSFGGDSSD